MIKRADLLPSSIVFNRHGEIATYWDALASMPTDTDSEPAPISGVAIGWVNLKPVLITDEWMFKAGFKQEGGSSVWWKDKFALWDNELCSKEPDGRYRTRRENVICVHDLQKGWFDTAGEELQIKAP